MEWPSPIPPSPYCSPLLQHTNKLIFCSPPPISHLLHSTLSMTARCQPPNGRGSARSSPPPLTHVGHLQQRAGHLLPSAAHLSRQTTPLLPPQTPAMLDLACCQGYPGQVAAAHRQAQAAAPPFSQPLGHASMPCPWIIGD
jgi:hypothetical protein